MTEKNQKKNRHIIAKHDPEYGELHSLVTENIIHGTFLKCSVFKNTEGGFDCEITSSTKKLIHPSFPFSVEECVYENIPVYDAIYFIKLRPKTKITSMKIVTKEGRTVSFNYEKPKETTEEEFKILHQYYLKFLDYGLHNGNDREKNNGSKRNIEKKDTIPTFRSV